MVAPGTTGDDARRPALEERPGLIERTVGRVVAAVEPLVERILGVPRIGMAHAVYMRFSASSGPVLARGPRLRRPVRPGPGAAGRAVGRRDLRQRPGRARRDRGDRRRVVPAARPRSSTRRSRPRRAWRRRPASSASCSWSGRRAGSYGRSTARSAWCSRTRARAGRRSATWLPSPPSRAAPSPPPSSWCSSRCRAPWATSSGSPARRLARSPRSWR